MSHKYLAIMFLFCIHVTSLYLFTRGFLLTRREIPLTSECNSPPPLAFDGEWDCWLPPRFKRIVLIVIDAWRYDFARWDDEFMHNSEENDPKRYYKNQMSSVNDAIADQPDSAFLAKFLSDAPTVTMQRLKGLTTGSFPTFIDVGSNFDSDEISEDNVIDQLRNLGKRAVFLGDDTWEMLFPSRFTRSYPYPSFNVKDINTVDNGVLEHLMPELRGERGDWDVIIAHFLGVDHVGHTYGPEHPAMRMKLRLMDDTLRDVMTVLDNDTLLFVMGDHGMTPDGNHGGSDVHEIETALFAYSTRSLNLIKDSDISVFGSKFNEGIPQIAFPPTLALLLGVPIPFGSLGAVIPDLFLYGGSDTCEERSLSYSRFTDALRLNAAQVDRYLGEYGGLDTENIRKLRNGVKSTTLAHDELLKMAPSYCTSADEHRRLALQYTSFLNEASHLCHEAWTQFNLFDMSWGIAVGLIALIGVPIAIFVNGRFQSIMVIRSLVIVIGLVIVVPSWIIPKLATLMLSIVGLTAYQFKVVSFKVPRLGREQLMIAVLGVTLHLISLFSNSLIEAEGDVTRYLSTSILACLSIAVQIRAPQLRLGAIMMTSLIASRLSSVYRIGVDIQIACRDVEDGEYWIHAMTETFVPLIIMAWYGIKYQLWVLSLFGCAMHWLSHCMGFASYPYTLPRFIFALGFFNLVYSCYKKDRMGVLLSVLGPVILILGPMAPRTVLLLAIQVYGFIEVVRYAQSTLPMDPVIVMIVSGIWWGLWTQQAFFDTGHRAKISALHVSAAFLLSGDYSFILNGTLMSLNTFAAYIVCTVCAYTVFGRSDIMLGVMVWRVGAQAVSTSMFVFFARRHLMVHAVFAPKYIFDVISGGVVEVVVLLIGLIC